MVTMKNATIAALIVAIALVAWWQFGPGRVDPSTPLVERGSGKNLTIAATGDSLILRALPRNGRDDAFDRVVRIVQSATLGVTNLEQTLLNESTVPPAPTPAPRWGYGTARDADSLKRMGFTTVSLANNHTLDYGVDGMKQTLQILDAAGLAHAGAGDDLEQARRPVYTGRPGQVVAVISVATSAAAESRATLTRGEIRGRPGVSPLKYEANVTLDPATFATLKKAAIASRSPSTEDELTLFGKPIKRGERTAVDFVPDEQHVRDVLADITTARSKADVVVLMIHSHEPNNPDPKPAEFVQRFARAAVDAGATLVVGHGPHQLRGIEIYKGAAIFYSLGNFIFDYGAVDARATDLYDSGIDLYRVALGAFDESRARLEFDAAEWWESVVAVATFEQGVLTSIRLEPIDLGVGLPVEKRGTPRSTSAQTGTRILTRLATLSEPFGTRLQLANGTAVVDVPAQTR